MTLLYLLQEKGSDSFFIASKEFTKSLPINCVLDDMNKSEYIPLLISKINTKDISEDVKRMLVGFEVAGQYESLYGIEYVAGEWGEPNAGADRKVELFIQDVVDGDLASYREQFERIEEEHGGEIDSALREYDE